MGTIADAIASEANVLAAWNTSVDRMDDGWVPAEFDAFSEHLLVNLARLSDELAGGRWTPEPTRRAAIPKPDGTVRILNIPPLRDRVAERAILQILTPIIDPHLQPDSYGARPGLGVDDALRAVCEQVADGQPWLVRADIADCFGSLRHTDVCEAVLAFVSEERVGRMLTRALTREVGATAGVGIAQGAPLSALAANVVLDRLDRELWTQGITGVRFLDDMCIAASSEREANRALRVLGSLSARLGLSLSESKSYVSHVDHQVSFLGRRIAAEATPVRTALPRRASIYVLQPGSSLRAKGDKFVVSTPTQARLRHPAARTRMIVCGPRMMLSTAVLALAHEHAVDVAVTDPYRGITGFFTSAEPRGRYIAAQHAVAADEDQRVAVARCFVAGKITNSRVLLMRTKRRRALVDPAVTDAMAAIVDRVRQAETTAELIGCEGAAARLYFDAWKVLLPREWRFSGRNRRPPRDPVNAMLSYSYTLLAAEVRRAVALAGLDPYCGLLHSSGRKRPSLVCDLMEEFRPLIVDTVVLRLIAVGAVDIDEFVITGGGCRMDQRVRRVVVEALEDRLLTPVTHPVTRRATSYRECIEAQAQLLGRRLITPTELYYPFPWR